MKSILENRPALTNEVNKAAEVAGYLWQKGWAERNGGNIVVNITEFVDDEIRALAPISEVKAIGIAIGRQNRHRYDTVLHLRHQRGHDQRIAFFVFGSVGVLNLQKVRVRPR